MTRTEDMPTQARTANVIPLTTGIPTTAYEPAQNDLPHAPEDGGNPLAIVDAYWHAIRRGRLVPARSDVDPRGIEAALSHAFIIERIAPGHGRVRIAGTHLADLMGMEVRGMPLSALFEPAARPRLQSALHGLFNGPQIVKCDVGALAKMGKPALSGQLWLFPMHSDGGAIDRGLGCFVTKGMVGRAPRRFSIGGLTRQALYGEDQAFDAAPRAVGFAEAQARFTHTDVPYLKVVDTDE